MKLYRIGLAGFPLLDGTGAQIGGGRWNSPGRRVIYTAPNLSCGRLEVMVGINQEKLTRQFIWTEISVPEVVSRDIVDRSKLSEGWDGVDPSVCRRIGDDWLNRGRAAILLVPSVASPEEINALINQDHEDFLLLTATNPKSLAWDPRIIEKLRLS